MNIKHLVSFSIIITLVSCGTMSPSLLDQQIGEVDPNNCSYVKYPGTGTTLQISLYKINNIPRTEYLEKTLFWSYTQAGSLGFSVKLPLGVNTFEFVNLKSKEIVKVTTELTNSKYEFDLSNGYELFEISENNTKKNVSITIEKIQSYEIQPDANTGVLSIENKSNNKVVLFRINDSAPSVLEQKLVGNYIFNNFTKPYTINLAEGNNTLEIGITGISNGYDGQKYFVVHKLEINVQPGKKYKIEVEEKKVDNIVILRPVIIEN